LIEVSLSAAQRLGRIECARQRISIRWRINTKRAQQEKDKDGGGNGNPRASGLHRTTRVLCGGRKAALGPRRGFSVIRLIAGANNRLGSVGCVANHEAGLRLHPSRRRPSGSTAARYFAIPGTLVGNKPERMNL